MQNVNKDPVTTSPQQSDLCQWRGWPGNDAKMRLEDCVGRREANFLGWPCQHFVVDLDGSTEL